MPYLVQRGTQERENKVFGKIYSPSLKWIGGCSSPAKMQQLRHPWRTKDKDMALEDVDMSDPGSLSDDDLKATLLKYRIKSGPIVASTRALYEKKLKKLLQSERCNQTSGAEETVELSDSEAEEEGGEQLVIAQDKETSEQLELKTQPERSQEPVKEIFKDISPDTAKITPKGIYITCQRPIKGAAPVKYVYPDSPVSPMTMQRQEVHRNLVHIHIQILVFCVVACILYLIFVSIDDSLN
ncbi:uncharacterized protein KZ484_015563 [Pholidichthys leucotaenia]